MKPIDELLKLYQSWQKSPTVGIQEIRAKEYLAVKTFALRCNLCTFNEIELMEYEANNQ